MTSWSMNVLFFKDYFTYFIQILMHLNKGYQEREFVLCDIINDYLGDV